MGYDHSSPSETPQGQKDIHTAQSNRVQQLAKLKPKQALAKLGSRFNARVDGENRLISLRDYQKELVIFAAVRKYINSSEYVEAVNALLANLSYLQNSETILSFLMECASNFGKKTTGETIKSAATRLKKKIGEAGVVKVHTKVDAHQAIIDRYR